ncbi:EAL domain-containing protein [Roseitalea porphyridii]|uniref:EAL domain-containing protein n=1 Tax=Roseitalea porphyridii TaxID=1852022 RepID=A0A4P6V4L7_9HYPH|nr:EAL domain-containing protein [Roseitalea porphyridii]QBK31530.1 EAL domain-containing protein [Roseitalea porphyridii]
MMTIDSEASERRPRRTIRNDDGTVSALDGTVIVNSAFQPVFRHFEDRLYPVAFEALARPFRNDTPLLPDAYFGQVPVTELRAVEALVRHIHVQNARHLPHNAKRLFLNFHPAGLGSPGRFEADLDALGADLRQVGVSPRDLVCEFTEHREQDEHDLKHFVYALRARGYLIAVDDFGAAFSDPARIARLTPDIVKIDGAVVRRLLAAEEGFDELKRLVDGFRRDGIRCVLEGLENMRQIELARRTGAHFLQGYALAAPQSAPGHFEPLMAAYRSEPGSDLVKALR